MTIKFTESDRRYHGGKLQYQSVTGWHDDSIRCARNAGKFKVYAEHMDCAYPYTTYYVADTETGEVMEYTRHLVASSGALAEIAEQVSMYGFDNPPEPEYDPNAFNPLAGL